jgi:hypothetical protein
LQVAEFYFQEICVSKYKNKNTKKMVLLGRLVFLSFLASFQQANDVINMGYKFCVTALPNI